MDHLPLPPGAPSPYPKVQCKCARRDPVSGDLYIQSQQQVIETLGLDGFESATQAFKNGPKQIYSLDKAASFLQSWLWFGTIEHIFSIVGIVVLLGDFVVQDNVLGLRLDTKILHRYLWYWMAAESKAADEVRDEHWIAINECLAAVYQALMHYAAEKDELDAPEIKSVSIFGTYVIDDANNTLLAIALLGETLTNAQRVIYPDIAPRISWCGSLSLRKSLQQAGWCISAIRRLLVGGSIAPVSQSLYLSRMDRTRLSGTHEECNSRNCANRSIDTTEYRPTHVSDGCGCSDVAPSYPERQKMDFLLCNGHYPVLTYIQSDHLGNGLTVHKPLVKSQPQYVAISHVWSDGLGNLRENALPACQLEQIQHHVNSLYPERSSDIPFWIDTICVPREHTTRAIAIQRMRNVYILADKVLVLDASLRLMSISAPPEHLLIAIKFAPWSTRLWTWHESVLASRIYFQFGESALLGEQLVTLYHRVLPDRDSVIRVQDLLDDCEGSNGSLNKILLCAMTRPPANPLEELNKHPHLLTYFENIRLQRREWIHRQQREIDDITGSDDDNEQESESPISETESEIAAMIAELPDDAESVASRIAGLQAETAQWNERYRTSLMRKQRLEDKFREIEAAFSSPPATDLLIPSHQASPPGPQATIPTEYLTDPSIVSSAERLVDRIRSSVMSQPGSFHHWLRWFNPIFEDGCSFYLGLRSALRRLQKSIKPASEVSCDELREAISAVSTRITSWIEDEPICLANVLDLDVRRVQQAKPSERMEVLVRMWSILPRRLLFLPIPRLKTEGLRWMPRSFLGTDWAGVCYGGNRREAYLTDRGLLTEAMGGILNVNSLRTETDAFLIHGEHCYIVAFSDNENYRHWKPPDAGMAAIILENELEKTRLSERGCLITIQQEVDNIIYGRYELFLQICSLEDHPDLSARARHMAEDTQESLVPIIRPTFTSKRQEWCIS